jgi:ABC-type branched-subunit amino acid transport system ATPase component/ABC-type branched-subunit amino acid transport system permease subunit
LEDSLQNVFIFAVIGLTAGGAYALTAVGLVTIYRGSGVLNLAQCAIGMVGAYTFWGVYNGHEGTSAAFGALAAGIVVCIVLSLACYILIIRRLQRSGETARLIATLGILLVLQSAAIIHYGSQLTIVPSFLGASTYHIWGAPITESTILVLVLAIATSMILFCVFRYSRIGLKAIALQERPDAALTLGISPLVPGMVVWAVGGALAATGGIFVLPLTGLAPSQATLLLFPALAAALFGRFKNYLPAVVAAVAIGVFQSVLVGENIPTWLVNVVPFVIIVTALMIGGSTIPGRGLAESKLPRVGSGSIRWRSVIAIAVVLFVSVIVLPGEWSLAIAVSAIATLIGLSMVVVVGYAGQVSLASFAIAGMASLTVAHLSQAGVGFVPALLVSIVVGIAVGLLSGFPAFRVRGLDLAIATLGFSLAVETAVFELPQLTGGNNGIDVHVPSIFGFSMDEASHPQRFAILCLIVAFVVVVGVANLRRGPLGRRFVSVRANERGAAAAGISVWRTKLAAFAVSGALAGLAGGLLTYQVTNTQVTGFDVSNSISALGFTIVGGIGMLTGGAFAGLMGSGGVISYFFRTYSSIDGWLSLASGVFVIYVMLTHPDGEVDRYAKALRRLEGSVARWARSTGLIRPVSNAILEAPPLASAPAAWADKAPTSVGSAPSLSVGSAPSLVVAGLVVDYAGNRAVDDVSFQVHPGKIIGLIGPNGAGKTSVIDAISGFWRSAAGEVTLAGTNVTGWSPSRRAQGGLIRTFQNLELFLDLTVRENLLAAADRPRLTSDLIRILVPRRAALDAPASRAISLLGLTSFLDTEAGSLPQGVRRLVAVCRAFVSAPKVVCLDEPTAGLSGAERAAFISAVRGLSQAAGVAVLLIEHNIDVVGQMCDEVIALERGRVIATGQTESVLRSEPVRRAYLGSDDSDSPSAIAMNTHSDDASLRDGKDILND